MESKRHDPRGRNRGGVIHTYQQYDPQSFPSPTQPPPDLISPAFEHMLMYGSRRELTEEELARAVKIDPSQIKGLGPSIDALIAMLQERKRKILETYESDSVQREAGEQYHRYRKRMSPPKGLAKQFNQAYQEEQLYDLERLWYALPDDRSKFARQLVQLVGRLGDKYQIDQLAAKYDFTGRTSMTIEQAIQVKEELEKIDKLLEQLQEAMKTAQIAVVDLEALAEYTEPGDMERLQEIQRMVENYVKDMAERQGLEKNAGRYSLTPEAYRIFQGRLLERIFAHLQSSRTGRHQNDVVGEGAVELQQTKSYEFGDSITNMDIPQSMINAMLRDPDGRPVRLRSDDIVVHRTRNSPKCATVVIMDMSGSMRYEGQYINVKRMALALDGLIRSEYPGDFLQFVQMFTFAEQVPPGEIIDLGPKPVTVFDPVVRYRIDMSRDDVTESMIPPHFTNIQHALQKARLLLAAQDTPNRQVILITDGLPTAHFDQSDLFLLYPPDPLTEEATMREGRLCQREGITINMFLIPSWSQSEEDIRFAYRLAESTKGRVFFTAGKDLDRYVVWDYVDMKREILG